MVRSLAHYGGLSYLVSLTLQFEKVCCIIRGQLQESIPYQIINNVRHIFSLCHNVENYHHYHQVHFVPTIWGHSCMNQSFNLI